MASGFWSYSAFPDTLLSDLEGIVSDSDNEGRQLPGGGSLRQSCKHSGKVQGSGRMGKQSLCSRLLKCWSLTGVCHTGKQRDSRNVERPIVDQAHPKRV